MMTIYSARLIYSPQTPSEIWTEAGENAAYFSETPKFFYSKYYGRYFIISDNRLYYSTDFKTWKNIYGDYIYDAKNDRIHKVTISKSGTNYIISVSKMTSLNVFDTAIALVTVPYNTYSYGDITCAEILGDYCIFSYSVFSRTGSGSSSVTDCYQGVIYTEDSTNWEVKSIYEAQGNCYQQTCLGSSGEKYVLLIATNDGFCPVVFTSPEEFTINPALWTAGNMTAAKGFYLNGIWHYADSGFGTARHSSDGVNFVSESNYWLNTETIFYKSKYISRDYGRDSLRCYDTDFETYTEIPLPVDELHIVLGAVNNEIYIISSDYKIYKAKLKDIVK